MLENETDVLREALKRNTTLRAQLVAAGESIRNLADAALPLVNNNDGGVYRMEVGSVVRVMRLIAADVVILAGSIEADLTDEIPF